MASPQSVRFWPTIDAYDNALKDASKLVIDPDIRKSKLLNTSGDSRPLRLNGKSSKYVSVYKMENKMENWVVRCFITNYSETSKRVIPPPPDLDVRYQAINSYLQKHEQRLAFLISQIWVERAVTISGQVLPFIKSKFVTAPKLGEFLEERHREPLVTRALAKQWLELIKVLESLTIAHGDLDITNVLVSGTYPNVALRLVDFDSMYVPALRGREMYEMGHENFSQPGVRRFDALMDRFPALVIYLSLIALAEDSQLWDRCKANEETKLLLGSDDFKNLENSFAYNLLRTKQSNRELQLCLDELAMSLHEHRVPKSLPEVLNSAPQRTVPTGPLSLSTYEARSIWIPLGQAGTNASPQPLEPAIPRITIPATPQPTPPMMIPIPTSYLQSSAPVASQGQAVSKKPAKTPAKKRSNAAAWWLFIFAVLSAVIAIAAHQPGLWGVTAILLIIMFAVSGKKSK